MRLLSLCAAVFLIFLTAGSFSASAGGQPRVYVNLSLPLYSPSISRLAWLIETEDRVLVRVLEKEERGSYCTVASKLYKIVSSSENSLLLEPCLESATETLYGSWGNTDDESESKPPFIDYALKLRDFSAVTKQDLVRGQRLAGGELFFPVYVKDESPKFTDEREVFCAPDIAAFVEGTFAPVDAFSDMPSFLYIDGPIVNPVQSAQTLLSLDLGTLKIPSKRFDFRFAHWGDSEIQVIQKELYAYSKYCGELEIHNRDVPEQIDERHIYYSYFDAVAQTQVKLTYFFENSKLCQATVSIPQLGDKRNSEITQKLLAYFSKHDSADSRVLALRKKQGKNTLPACFSHGETGIILNSGYDCDLSITYLPLSRMAQTP